MDSNDLWASYARAQRIADTFTISDKSWAADEAADVVLDEIERDQPISETTHANLLVNRAAKHRQRRRLLLNNMLVLWPLAASDESRIIARLELRRCERECRPIDWKVLIAVGFGETFEEIGFRLNVPAATAKTWARRARVRLAA